MTDRGKCKIHPESFWAQDLTGNKQNFEMVCVNKAWEFKLD